MVAELYRLVEKRTRLVPGAEPRVGLADEEGGLALLVSGQELGGVHRFEQVHDLLPQAGAGGRAPGFEDLARFCQFHGRNRAKAGGR